MTDEKLIELLKSMSLSEKISQLVQLHGGYFGEARQLTGPEQQFNISGKRAYSIGSILGECGFEHLKSIQDGFIENQPHHIPAIFMADVIHGFRTIFPVPIAQGASFNPGLTQKIGSAAARECSSAGLHATFSPMVDLARDSRWGRCMEGTGEDPWLNSRFAESAVKGFQGDSCGESGKIAACAKHFAAYGSALAGRDYSSSELCERTLMEDYLPSYEAAVKAGVELVMTAFNTVDRIPCSINKKVMRKILREKMGFEGVLISDYNAIGETLAHGACADKSEAARRAMNCTVDIDMMSDCYLNHLEDEINSGRVDAKLLDEACLRILRLKNKLGLFENPYKDGSTEAEEKYIYCDEFLKLSRTAAEETTILLKNNGILPLDTNKRIAIVGSLAASRKITGSWAIFAQEEHTVTLESALKELYADADITYICKDVITAEELLKISQCDAVIVAVGEDQSRSGEGKSVAETVISEEQSALLGLVASCNKNIVSIVFGGRPLCLGDVDEVSSAVIEAWLPGTCGAYAVADILFGRVNPSARVPMSFPYSTGQLPLCYSELPSGRPKPNEERYYPFMSNYMDVPNKPLYPFGHGLSYTKFEYSDVSLSSDVMKKGETITAEVTIKNTGDMDGFEPVQLYIHDVKASVSRPVRQLKGLQKPFIKADESLTVSFTIDEEMLKFYDEDMDFTAESGEFEVFIGGSSETMNRTSFWLED